MSIDEQELLDLYIEASKFMAEEKDRCGNLLYTQKKSGKHIIREPEVAHVLGQLLSQRGINFGVEVPTEKKYLISGEKPDTAAVDLAIFTGEKQINIELKGGQPNVKEIEKDFKKFLGEPVQGCSFFHILKNTNAGTMPSLLEKYSKAYKSSLSITEKVSKWFLLFIFVKEKKTYYWQIFKDITDIQDNIFKLNSFLKK